MDDPIHEVIVLTVGLDEERGALRIELDDGSSFTVAPDAPEARGITPGLSVGPETIDGLRTADERKEIARRVFGWLDRRPRCRADLRQRLRQRGHDDALIDPVLDRFERQGLVDDREYAALWVEQAVRRRPVGRTWLWSRLRQQGVEASIATEAVQRVLGADDELEAAQRALAKRRFDLEDANVRMKAMRFLAQRGFGGAVAKTAIRQAREEDPA